MNLLVFEIATVPDIDGCRRLYDLHGLSDEDVARAVFHRRRQQRNTESLPPHLQRIVVISAVLRAADQFRVWSLGDANSAEKDLLQRFYSGIARYSPRLVSWNGGAVDLPVIRYRSLLYPLNAAHYWETGDSDKGLVDGIYPGRDPQPHTGLIAALSGSFPGAVTGLDEVAGLCGFPGRMGADDPDIWSLYLREDIEEVRRGCEINVLNTYLVYLNYERNRGNLDQAGYLTECRRVRESLAASPAEHLREYEKAWIDPGE